MPRPFNTYVRGFLGLVSAKVRGQSPSDFEEALRLTLDGYQFFMAERAELWRAATNTITGVGFNPAATPFDAATPVPWIVPQGEIWLVDYAATMGVVSVAGGVQQNAVGYRASRYSASGVQGQISPPSPALPHQSLITASTTERLLFLPGDEIGCITLQGGTTPANTITLQLRLVRVQI